MQTITLKQVQDLTAQGHVVYGYPKRGEVVVDGFKRYAATPAVANAARDIGDMLRQQAQEHQQKVLSQWTGA